MVLQLRVLACRECRQASFSLGRKLTTFLDVVLGESRGGKPCYLLCNINSSGLFTVVTVKVKSDALRHVLAKWGDSLTPLL